MTQRRADTSYSLLDPFKGYKNKMKDEYSLGKVLGKGGYGIVFRGTRKKDGHPVAVKRLPKVGHVGDTETVRQKQSTYVQSVKTEVEILLSLRGSLGVIWLHDVYQDEDYVYMVMELCSGGHLIKKEVVGKSSKTKLSEHLVSRYMRNVLQFVAVCHARHIIHRDIKPANFLFLDKNENSPIKVIDFGLSKYFRPEELPVTASTAAGTPWYLAPEACRGHWWPKTDVWACGVMTFYMLTGSFPFMDRSNTIIPDLPKTLKAICYEELDLTREECQHLSPLAKDFLQCVLAKDLDNRFSAEECLLHPWIQSTEELDASPLDPSVLQRLQRFSQNGVFKCTILEHIGRELVSMHFGPEDKKSFHAEAVFKERSVRGGGEYAKLQNSHSRTLPNSTVYSRNLIALLDSVKADGDGHINRQSLHELLISLGHSMDVSEAEEIFQILDTDKKGYLNKQDIAVGLIDWEEFSDTFKDRWIETLRRVFQDLDHDKDGSLSAQEIAAAFEGGMSIPEVDAAVHDVIVQISWLHQERSALSGTGSADRSRGYDKDKISFDEFLDFMSSENGMHSLLFQDRKYVEDDLPAHEEKEPNGSSNMFKCCFLCH